MTPNFFPPIADEAFEVRMENAVFRAEQLYDLDGETFFRSRDGRIETGSWEADQ